MDKERAEFLSDIQEMLDGKVEQLRELEHLANTPSATLDGDAAEKLLSGYASIADVIATLKQFHRSTLDVRVFGFIRECEHLGKAYGRVLRKLLIGKALCGHPGKCNADHSAMKGADLTAREEANAITGFAFRNGFLEELHTGEDSELLENPKLSRITDPEMKKLMIESSAMIADVLEKRDHDPAGYWKLIEGTHKTYTKNWDKG